MTYKELEERVNQQGTQCGVNLMSSAVLEVEVNDDPTDASAAGQAVADAFEAQSDEDLAEKLLELLNDSKLPNIRIKHKWEYKDGDVDITLVSVSPVVNLIVRTSSSGGYGIEIEYNYAGGIYSIEF